MDCQDIDKAIAASERVAAVRFDAHEKELSKFEHAMEARFLSVNEFRQALSDQAAQFCTRSELSAMVNGNCRDLVMAIGRLDRLEGVAAGADKAVAKSEAAAEKRFESINEFRMTLSDQAGSFITRNEVDAMYAGFLRDSAAHQSRIDKIEAKAGGAGALGGSLAVGASLLLAAASFVFSALGT